MKKKSYSKRRRDESDSDSSSSSYSSESSKRPEDMYSDLKVSLIHNDRYLYRAIHNISKHFKNQVGILRITLTGSFTFSQTDIEDFFKKFGKIENVILKQSSAKNSDKQGHQENNENIQKQKQQQSIAYVIYSDYFAAVLALKVLNSVPEKDRLIKAKLCSKNINSGQQQLFSEPLIHSYSLDDMIMQVENDGLNSRIQQKQKDPNQMVDENQQIKTDEITWLQKIMNQYKYVGTIGLDLSDPKFRIRQRILGVQGSNFIRIYYLCQKSFRFENQQQQSCLQDLKLKLLVNKQTNNDRYVLVMSHSLQKYNQAIRFLHQLLEQIVQEYKNSREKSAQIIAKDIHIKRWEKFAFEPQLKFLT